MPEASPHSTVSLIVNALWRDIFHGKLAGYKPRRGFYQPNFQNPYPHYPSSGPLPNQLVGLDETLSNASKNAVGKYRFLMTISEGITIVRLVGKWEKGAEAFESAKEFIGVYNSIADQLSAKTGIETDYHNHEGIRPDELARGYGPSLFDEQLGLDLDLYECQPQSVTNSTVLAVTMQATAPQKNRSLGQKKRPLEALLEEEGFSKRAVFPTIHTPHSCVSYGGTWQKFRLKWTKENLGFDERYLKELAEKIRDTALECGIKGEVHISAFLNYNGLFLVPELMWERSRWIETKHGGSIYQCLVRGEKAIDNFSQHQLAIVTN